MSETLSLVLAPAVALLLLLFYINLRLASPLLVIPIRWLICINTSDATIARRIR